MVAQKAIVPGISISEALENWPRIRKRLMENARKRQLQANRLLFII